MLLGREGDRAAARRALDDRGLLALVGPAGIGKSSLAAAVAPGPVVRTGALATLRWVPLLAFRRIVGDRVVSAAAGPEPIARAVLRGRAGSLIVDDVQWADVGTFEVAARLIGRLPVVVTVRSGEEGAEEALELLDRVGAVRMDVGPLGDGDAELLLDRLHPGLGGGDRARVLEAAGGNPLLLAELPRGAHGAATLVAVLVERLRALDPATVEAAHRLALLGRPATAQELGPGARSLVAAGLAEAEGQRYRSTHGLLDEVILDQLHAASADVRRRLSGLVDPGEAAFLLAAAGDRAEARALAIAAADEAPDLALRAELLALAVELADDLDLDRRIEAARLLTRTSQPERARALCAVDGLDELGRLERGQLLGATAEAAWLEGDHGASRASLERALVDLAGTGHPVEVLVLAGSTVHSTFLDLDGRQGLDRAQAAVELADRLGVHRAYARLRLASVLATAGLPGGPELHREAMELAREDGDDEVHQQAFTGLVLGTWVNGDVRAAADLARSAVDPGGEDLDLHELGFRAYVAILGLLAGDAPEDVVAQFRPIVEQEPIFRNRGFMVAAVALALADGGRHGEALDLLGPDPVPPGIDAQQRSIDGWASVEVRWLAGRDEAALDAVAAVEALGVGDYPSAVMARLVAAHAARALGGEPHGPAPAPLLPAWKAAPIEWSALVEAAAGRADIAAGRFLEAADAWTGCDVRSVLRCRWAAGDVLVGIDAVRAQARLEDAERAAGAAGSLAMVERARRSLRGLGVRRRGERSARSAAALAGLTAREEQVLELVGEGRTTSQISAELGVAPSTVESFVRSAARKLGVGTRVAAAAELERRRGEARR